MTPRSRHRPSSCRSICRRGNSARSSARKILQLWWIARIAVDLLLYRYLQFLDLRLLCCWEFSYSCRSAVWRHAEKFCAHAVGVQTWTPTDLDSYRSYRFSAGNPAARARAIFAKSRCVCAAHHRLLIISRRYLVGSCSNLSCLYQI